MGADDDVPRSDDVVVLGRSGVRTGYLLLLTGVLATALSAASDMLSS